MTMIRRAKLARHPIKRILSIALFLVSAGCCPRVSPMPDNAFRAKIDIANPPLVLGRGETKQIEVSVKNLSELDWQTHGERGGKYRTHLGNHWLDADGKSLFNDDGRANLPNLVKSGETTQVSLIITAPQNVGDYILELDLVQEEYTWFALKGSKPSQYKIKVE